MGKIGGFCRFGLGWFRFPSLGGRFAVSVDRYWHSVCSWSAELWQFLLVLVLHGGGCYVRGFYSLFFMDSTAVLFVMWSGYLSLTSMPCLVYVLLVLGAAEAAAACNLDCICGLLILGFFGMLALWKFGYFWIIAILCIAGGYMFSTKCARLLILVSTIYSIYHVCTHTGWLGTFLSLNTAFISNDLLYKFCQEYHYPVKEEKQFEDCKETNSVKEEYMKYFDSCASVDEAEHLDAQKEPCKTNNTSTFMTDQKNSSCLEAEQANSSAIDEMKRIIRSLNYYEAIGFSRNNYIDQLVLRKEYRKKAMLVHPDKNMGNPLAVESFKKIQCAYEVLSDMAKKKDYDEQLRRDEFRSIRHNSRNTYRQNSVDFRPRESRHVECTRCRKSHPWMCTTRSKIRARWCQDCHLYHPAKDGDGWVESERSVSFSTTHKMNIPRAFTCLDNKIYDVSEWASCQGTLCPPNTHSPSFRVNKIGVNKSTPRLDPSRHQWELRTEMITEEEHFEIWLKHAMSTGLLTPKQKSWSPLKILNHTKGKLSRRMSLP